jgi:hypothetical protein
LGVSLLNFIVLSPEVVFCESDTLAMRQRIAQAATAAARHISLSLG